MSDIKLACDVAEQIKTICDKHGNNPGELINILHEAQHLQGYLPEEIQRIIASKLEIPVSKGKGNTKAKIRALNLNAIQLRIADSYARRPDHIKNIYVEKSNTFTPEEARNINGSIVILKINDK